MTEINPPHYRQGLIECIAAIEAALTPEEFRGYLKGNIIKYTWRERYKHQDVDLRKGLWYLLKLLKEEGKLNETRKPQAPVAQPAQGATPQPTPTLPPAEIHGADNDPTPSDSQVQSQGQGKAFKIPSSIEITAFAEALRDREIPA